jgi:hypothetical protein
MLVAEIKDQCAEARALLTVGKLEAGLAILNQVIVTTDDPIMQNHPMMGVVFALKAEVLQSLDLKKVDQTDYVAQALNISNQHLYDDFENVAPILLNVVRYYVKEKQQDQARSAADLMLAGCTQYYGKDHPRLFQLQRWIEEAGCY